MYLSNSVQKIMSHFPEKISNEIDEYVTEVVLKDSRYLFVKRSGSGQQYGYCTHCKNQYRTDNLKHNQHVTCSSCYSSCVVKQSGISRKYLRDEAFLVWYDKSLINPKTITARGILVQRDYSGDYQKVKTEFNVTSMYLFEPGKSTMIQSYNDQFWKKTKINHI